MIELSNDSLLVLSCLPKEPLTVSIQEIAKTLFGRTDSIYRSKVKKGLDEVSQYLFVQIVNTEPYRHRDHYGIRADKWETVKDIFFYDVDLDSLSIETPAGNMPGLKRFGRHDGLYDDSKIDNATKPTRALPRSPEKIEIMRRRAEQRKPIFNDNDGPEMDLR